MTSRTEAAVIRSKLQLKHDVLSGEYYVYTTLHGSGHFKWFKVSHETFKWYQEKFPEISIITVNNLAPNKFTGALI